MGVVPEISGSPQQKRRKRQKQPAAKGERDKLTSCAYEVVDLVSSDESDVDSRCSTPVLLDAKEAWSPNTKGFSRRYSSSSDDSGGTFCSRTSPAKATNSFITLIDLEQEETEDDVDIEAVEDDDDDERLWECGQRWEFDDDDEVMGQLEDSEGKDGSDAGCWGYSEVMGQPEDSEGKDWSRSDAGCWGDSEVMGQPEDSEGKDRSDAECWGYSEVMGQPEDSEGKDWSRSDAGCWGDSDTSL